MGRLLISFVLRMAVLPLTLWVPFLRMLSMGPHTVLKFLDSVRSVQGPLLSRPSALLRHALQHRCEVVRHVVRHHARGDEDTLLNQILQQAQKTL